MTQHTSQGGWNNSYKKLYFLWYFDDDLGFGLDVMAEQADNTVNNGKFVSLVNWSFGFGTEARDLRRAWGDHVASISEENGGKLPPELLSLRLVYTPGTGLQGDWDKVKQLLDRT
ncbi:MAG: hypothetical protein M0Z55_08275 [Peptococcaceae bacterium]|nr:hypothetical protein [Peptococcaceae bacterium]